jgi:aerobic C4-dicarboxylate transport protein
MPQFFRTIYGQVVVGLVIGLALGVLFPGFAVDLKPLGDAFIKLIKMIIAPLVFCVIVSGICGAGDIKKVGRVGVKAIVYFELITTLALIIGIVLAFTLRPGVGMNIDPSTLDSSAIKTYTTTAGQTASTVDFLMKLIPATVVDAFAKGDILQVMVFAIPFGFAVSLMGETGRPVIILIDRVLHALFRVMGFIVRLAPFGVLGAIAFTTGKYGVGSLKQLGFLLAVFYLSCVVFVLVVLGAVMRFAGFSVLKFIAYLKDELFIVLGTASSDSVLPQIMRKLENLGISNTTVGLVIPTGYSFNLDGFSIYLTLATIFIAQATNTPLSTVDLLAILTVSLVTSKGAHGVPGSALVILAATLSAIPALPVAGLALVLAVDWFMGIGRALTNLLGNCIATVVVAVWEKDIDKIRARRVLAGEAVTQLAPELEQIGEAGAVPAPGSAIAAARA